MLSLPEGCLEIVNEGLLDNLGFGQAALMGGVLLVDMDAGEVICIASLPARIFQFEDFQYKGFLSIRIMTTRIAMVLCKDMYRHLFGEHMQHSQEIFLY